MNAKLRSWIRAQTEIWEARATKERDTGDERIAGVYQKVARDFRVMVRTDPFLARMNPSPSAEILAQQIYESFAAAAYETGHSTQPAEVRMQWQDAPKEYKDAMIETAGDILRSGMIEMIVGEAMHRERLETGERALLFWERFEDGMLSMSETRELMKRLPKGFVDD